MQPNLFKGLRVVMLLCMQRGVFMLLCMCRPGLRYKYI